MSVTVIVSVGVGVREDWGCVSHCGWWWWWWWGKEEEGLKAAGQRERKRQTQTQTQSADKD